MEIRFVWGKRVNWILKKVDLILGFIFLLFFLVLFNKFVGDSWKFSAIFNVGIQFGKVCNLIWRKSENFHLVLWQNHFQSHPLTLSHPWPEKNRKPCPKCYGKTFSETFNEGKENWKKIHQQIDRKRIIGLHQTSYYYEEDRYNGQGDAGIEETWENFWKSLKKLRKFWIIRKIWKN